ncbi:DNA primase [Fibrobacter sp. UWR2]|uniref:DNA primase n=1 Tax=Fibrobacter sp. UWR2 TaxID=1964352 RepID=UPI000B527634|nr:DNA primase [Fibrobacter sp. UWR2]OWV02125.1 DNA primase [Fibrobacter sp. UWR2]
MPFYPEEVIQQLKSQADISLVIQQFLPLKRTGTNRYVGVCPFHDDHSPSMNVNPTAGYYKCFACGAGGDVFKFVQEYEKIDFNGAVEWVANFVGFDLPKFASKENAEVTEERAMVRKLNELACEWFEQQLTLSPKALEYLAKRSVSEKTRKEFHIGYAPDGRENFIAYAAKNGFSPRDCVKAGLATEKQNGGISDKFRDRLMIAIQNQSGVVVAFGGRDLAPKQEGFERPKYMNSPDTALYNKSEILFGLNHSRAAISKENAVIIVEGYFDLISLYQGGVQNVVAASGTALTEFHANILARYAKTAYLVFDGDAAGQKATMRSLEIVLPKGINPRIFALSRPDGTKIDPDNFVNEQGADAFREQLKNAEDWLSYLARKKDLSSIESRASFVTYVKSIVKSIQDSELRNQYVKLISERFNTTRSLEGIQSIKPQRAPKAPAPQPQPSPELAEYGEMPPAPEPERIPWEILPPVEIRFANLLVSNPTLIDRACEYFDVELAASGIQFFESSLIEEFVNTIIAIYSETGYFSPRVLYEQLSPLLKQFMENLPEESWTPPKEIIELYESLMVLTFRLCDRFRKSIALDTPEGVQKRIELNKFMQNMEKLDRQYKDGRLSIDMLADQLIRSKTPLINTLSVTKG